MTPYVVRRDDLREKGPTNLAKNGRGGHHPEVHFFLNCACSDIMKRRRHAVCTVQRRHAHPAPTVHSGTTRSDRLSSPPMMIRFRHIRQGREPPRWGEWWKHPVRLQEMPEPEEAPASANKPCERKRKKTREFPRGDESWGGRYDRAFS